MAELTMRDVPGIRVGHLTDAERRTGCTVILAPDGGAIAGVDVRGSAPGTRETDLIRPTALVERVNAICLAGGSAFGLAAADGVVRRLAERGIGFATGVRPVPIVPAAILFDLGVGDASAFPDADAGYAAAIAAEANDGELEGRVGAGAGATVAKLAGPEAARPGGVGSAARRLPDGTTLGALVVNNALGNIHARDGRPLAVSGAGSLPPPAVNTTLVVVATDASLDRAQCRKLAELGHDALAIGIRPTHTMFDGDVVFCFSTGEGSRGAPEAFFGLQMTVLDAVGEAIERSVALGEAG
ncbi:MAG TPA: P1 family peptidase [Candidatus Limnocylindria bacterium]|nr:P1 family peptidase [Candidatus Limnocylindria bacterium]